MRLTFLALLLAACSSPMVIEPVKVQDGIHRKTVCAKDGCYCDARLTRAMIVEDDGDAVEALNTALAEPVRKMRCEGLLLAEDPDDGEQNIEDNVAKYRVAYRSDRLVSVIYEQYHYPAGAAHGMSWITPFLIDVKAQKLIAENTLIPIALRGKAGQAVIRDLRRLSADKYDNALWANRYAAEGDVFTDAGCRDCHIIRTQKGWAVQYGQYTVGPYAIGMPEVPLDARYIDKRWRN